MEEVLIDITDVKEYRALRRELLKYYNNSLVG